MTDHQTLPKLPCAVLNAAESWDADEGLLGPRAEPRIRLTTFPALRAESKSEHSVCLRQLARQIQKKSAPTKKELPWLKLAYFGDEKTKNGSLRHEANMITISGIEGDDD